MNSTGIIYKITSPSGKVYVGQTIRSFETRVAEHKYKSSNCTLVKRAIDKYGDEMKYEIIESNIPQEQLDEREIYWIKELNSLAPNGYNCNSGGNAKHNIAQETRDKLRDSMNKSKIDKDGYLGYIHTQNGIITPRVKVYGKEIQLSSGSFHTEEEAIEILKEYTRDPENFSKAEGTYQREYGYIQPRNNKWRLRYKGNHIGYYPTQEEAEEARRALQSSTYSSSSESA